MENTNWVLYIGAAGLAFWAYKRNQYPVDAPRKRRVPATQSFQPVGKRLWTTALFSKDRPEGKQYDTDRYGNLREIRRIPGGGRVREYVGAQII